MDKSQTAAAAAASQLRCDRLIGTNKHRTGGGGVVGVVVLVDSITKLGQTNTKHTTHPSDPSVHPVVHYCIIKDIRSICTREDYN